MDDTCPWVSYIRLPKLHTVARCCDVSEFFLAVGTDTGYLLVFDRRRDHDLRVSQVHRSPMVALSLTTAYAISACDDQVAVYNLDGAYIKWTFDFINCLAVAAPCKYLPRQDVILVGNPSGLFSVQRPLTARTGTLPTPVLLQEGNVEIIRWSHGSLVAWRDDRSVTVRDMERQSNLISLPLESHLVRLCWAKDSPTLLVSCDNFFKVVRIHPPGNCARGEVLYTLTAPNNEVVCGACPDPSTEHEFFVLTCGASSQVHLIGPDGVSESSIVHNAHVTWHQAFIAYSDGMYIVVADGIWKVVRRNPLTHANWFISHDKYEEAVAVALGKPALIHKVLTQCVHRTLKRKVDRALNLIQTVQSKCAQAFTSQLWEDLALAFDERHKIEAIAPIIPSDAITNAVADLIIRRLTASEDPRTLLLLMETWSPDVFSVDTSLDLAIARIQETPPSTDAYTVLSEVIYRLHMFQGDVDTAFQVVIKEQSMSAFVLLEGHRKLFAAQYSHLETFERLIELDAERCARLYVQYLSLAPRDEVFRRLDPEPSESPQECLYFYCRALINTTPLSEEQSLRFITCLLRFGDADELLAFLEKTEAYNVEQALELIRLGTRNLEAEVYLLGRSGRTKEALTLLLSGPSLDKCAKAACFIHAQNDDKDLWQQFVDYGMEDPTRRISHVLSTWDACNPISAAKIVKGLPNMCAPANIAAVLDNLIADFDLEATLHAKCNDLAEAETASLARARYSIRHRGALIGAMHASLSPCPFRSQWSVESRPTGMRCSICDDPCLFGESIVALLGNAETVMHEKCAKSPARIS